ncbi:conjugal transfer protein TraH [Diaphorobacter sp. DS2]|nr:conjugal transfer protein TraH [Diaphorobacter sp. DS2]
MPRKQAFTLKRHVRAICAAATLVAVPLGTAGASGMQGQMDRVFGEMVNVTPPGVYETQRRGVLSGGRLTMKGKIVEEQVVGFVPPSWKGGCGGVDLFGGSFSFINAEQVVQLLRAVAANAKGYAFQLALDNIYPEGAKWIEAFQKKIQALNQHLGNSCQLAQGLVNDLTSSFELKGKTDVSLTGTMEGLFEDVFSSKQESGGKSATKTVRDNNPEMYKERFTGNIVWKQLQKNNVKSWFSGGDSALNRAIMTATGTVVIGDVDPDNPDTNPISSSPGIITLSDLIEGGNITIYRCGDGEDHCLELVKDTTNIVGLKTKIMNILLGNGTSVGIISKFAANQGILTTEEKNFMANMPVGMGAVVRNLAILSTDSAAMFATQSAGAIALSMSMSMVEQYFKAATVALASEQSAYKKEAIATMAASLNTLRAEYTTLQAKHGRLTDKLHEYNIILANSRKQRYMLSEMKKPSSSN